MKLFFHPGTNMAQAMAETIGYVNRSRAFMPPGTVPPFVMRFDTGSVPVGYLVLSSETKTIGEIQDQALFKVRPMFASLPGVSAPPPFGGNQRTVVVRADPERLRAYDVSPDERGRGARRTATRSARRATSASATRCRSCRSTRWSATSRSWRTSRSASAPSPAVYVRDVATVQDATDIPAGYALVNGRRAVYILVTKRADASTLVGRPATSRRPCRRCRRCCPDDIQVSFEFDQSPYVTNAMRGVAIEGALGAVLTGLMVLLFLRDWRSVIVVVLNIPLALAGALVALWLTGQTINLMTLGGLALAVGILVDEATVEIENIHTQMEQTDSVARAVRRGNAETAVPRLLAMLCILAVFMPSFFMQGAAQALFVPLSLAVGFAMIASYLLSSTFVPVLSVWLLRRRPAARQGRPTDRVRANPRRLRAGPRRGRPLAVGGRAGLSRPLRRGDRPGRPRAGPGDLPAGSTPGSSSSGCGARRERASSRPRSWPSRPWRSIQRRGRGRTTSRSRSATSGWSPRAIRSTPSTSGPAARRRPCCGSPSRRAAAASGRSRTSRSGSAPCSRERMPDVRFSFEPADIVNEVMSFGSPTPVEVAVSGPNLADEPGLRREGRGRAGRGPVAARPAVRASRSTIRRSRSRSTARRRGSAASRSPRSRGRWSRPRRRAGSSCRTTGPTRRRASATRCRSRSPTR